MKDVVKEQFAKQAYRTLLIAYTDLSYETYEQLKANNNDFHREADREVLESSLTVVGIFAL